MHYSRLRKMITENGDSVTMPRALFMRLLAGALRNGVEFDEGYYLETNLDVRQAVERGTIKTAAHHYYTTGYFEGRPGLFNALYI